MGELTVGREMRRYHSYNMGDSLFNSWRACFEMVALQLQLIHTVENTVLLRIDLRNQAKIHEALLFMLHARPKDDGIGYDRMVGDWREGDFKHRVIDFINAPGIHVSSPKPGLDTARA